MRQAALLALAFTFVGVTTARAQTRPAFFDAPATLTMVGAPAPGEHPPLVVFLPATGGTAQSMFEFSRAAIPFPTYVALIPSGAPASTDYLPNFGGFVNWMETRVLADLERAKAEHHVDPDRVYLMGFSLGGDTSWALICRHPDVFRGAVVMGSRASARPTSTNLRVMRERGRRIAFGIGRADDATRVTGADRAYAAMNTGRVTTQMTRYEGSHSPPDPTTLRSLVAFVMATP